MGTCEFRFLLNLECVAVKERCQLECKNLLMTKLPYHTHFQLFVLHSGWRRSSVTQLLI